MSVVFQASTDALHDALRGAGPGLVGNDALLAAVLSGSGDCIKILDLDGRLQFMSEGGKQVMEVDDFSLLKGCPWPDLWADEGNLAAKQAIEDARNGLASQFFGAANTARGTAKFWHVRVMPILGADGKPTHLLSISTDITEQKRTELALRESAVQARLAMSAAQMGLWQCQLINGALVNLKGDDQAADLLGGVPGEPLDIDILFERIDEAGRTSFLAAVQGALTQVDGILDVEYRLLPRGDEGERWVHARAQVLPSSVGKRVIGTVREISQRKTAELRQVVLGAELQHRIKNILAMVSAIAVQTLRGDDIADRRMAFSARLQALAHAHDLLTAKSWQGAPMRGVIEGALVPHVSGTDNFSLVGDDIELSAKQALSLALTVHELATNAAKYGATSVPGGTVAIRWGVEPDEKGDRTFKFVWQESGGPIVVEPERRGFGTRLITRVLSADFNGKVGIEYAPSGVVCTLASPITSVLADNPALA
ncbi:HWE histidine kinase domain-containing protein [Devosia sp. 2618]|uniref:HWE histidine kinase domain-containing protein n=1 Tax=Devosia sp. 2618 TaxID=3156454 RepID=UPI00339A3C06